MTTWLERREKVEQHALAIERKLHASHHHNTPGEHAAKHIGLPHIVTRNIKMARVPSVNSVRFDDVVKAYGATNILDTLADFIAEINYSGASTGVLQARSRNTVIPFSSIHVFHKIKFTSSPASSDIVDTIHVRAEQKDTNGRIIPSRFNTVLVHGKESNSIHG